jgi:hypothetical protein
MEWADTTTCLEVRFSPENLDEMARDRTGRDGPDEFQDRCLKPLGHPSGLATSNSY